MNFNVLVGFGYLVDTNTTYYALDWNGNKIIIFDSNWKYLNFTSLNKPAFMITVNSSLYISADYYVYKTDKYLNIISQHMNNSAYYRGLYYNSSSNSVYVSGYINCAIDVFDLNLTLVDSISTSPYKPYSLQGYKNYIYVGTDTGQFLVIENKVITKQYAICSGTFLTSILIDHFGFMALSCNNDRKAYLYYSSNMSYTGMSMTFPGIPWCIKFDSNGRLVVSLSNKIHIY